MNYTVLVNKQVLKTVKSLPKSQKKMLMEILEILKINPIPSEHFDIKKLKGFENVFRVRLVSIGLFTLCSKKTKSLK